jgi:hypothetical protein
MPEGRASGRSPLVRVRSASRKPRAFGRSLEVFATMPANCTGLNLGESAEGSGDGCGFRMRVDILAMPFDTVLIDECRAALAGAALFACGGPIHEEGCLWECGAPYNLAPGHVNTTTLTDDLEFVLANVEPGFGYRLL